MKYHVKKSVIMDIIFLFIYIILQQNICVLAVNTKCLFKSHYVRINEGTKFVYGCILINDSTSGSTISSRISDEHEEHKTDNNVQLLYVNHVVTMKMFTKEICEKFENLEFLVSSNAKVESIAENSLYNCKKLNFINLSRNRIQEIPSQFFVQSSNLTDIDISKNQIKTLPSNLFHIKNQIQLLHLSENQIESLPFNVFRFLIYLEKLSLMRNMLKNLNSEWFSNLKNLKELNLSFNFITELPENIFTFLEKLKILDLRSNKLKTLHADSFGRHPLLTYIDVSENEINSMNPFVIDYTAVSELDMTQNICANKKISVRNDMIEQLQNCFEYYQLRREKASDTKDEKSKLCNEELNTEKNEIKAKLKMCFGEYETYQAPKLNNSIGDCGKVKAGRETIIGGSEVVPGNHPWHVALLKTDSLEVKLICGGTLISNKQVVTAAHCVLSILPRNIIAVLGVYNISAIYEVGRISVAIEKIHIHPDYKKGKFDGDIAVLILEKEIQFTEKIQPICLIDFEPNVETITNPVVIGHGINEQNNIGDILKVTSSPIQTDKVCYNQYGNLSYILSYRTLCAGDGNGTGICDGDSGGGLLVSHKNVFYLRGIISASLKDGKTIHKCNVQNYGIFTNMLMFNDWIKALDAAKYLNYFDHISRASQLLHISTDDYIDNTIKEMAKKFGNKRLSNFGMTCVEDLTALKIKMDKKIEKCLGRNEIQNSIQNSRERTRGDSLSCGKPLSGIETIFGGTAMTRGSFPWIAAIMDSAGKFFCGGTLVSNTKVVTAAHCIIPKRSTVKFKQAVYVILGSHNLKDATEVGRVLADVKTIMVHPHWNPNVASFDADIAVLILEKPVEFNEHIQPICLLDPDSPSLKIPIGVVVGYGRSEYAERHENIPRKIDYPIHDFYSCASSDSVLESLVSNRGFCGGYANGTGTCTGDSGSGLYVLHKGSYYLRGIVSASLMDTVNACNVNRYSVLTDAAEFYSFITTGNLDVRQLSREKLKELIRSAAEELAKLN